ncbi:hypothetical protein [Streptomyces cylindrosporus]|uniref:Uncharacterized protein n=1 Tax=Streptomyces cylindrosporus TaxID=2927583 RepID=A0ABS9Y475_9ACTN|nr:hypothetical protein [Streptomyces cylindrosporus]MCI3271315.1 hypothetical protein [Streptomyces cylindrosporus]
MPTRVTTGPTRHRDATTQLIDGPSAPTRPDRGPTRSHNIPTQLINRPREPP